VPQTILELQLSLSSKIKIKRKLSFNTSFPLGLTIFRQGCISEGYPLRKCFSKWEINVGLALAAAEMVL
jgi:hypothetical protein